MEDLKLVVNWANHKWKDGNMVLITLMTTIKEVLASFSLLFFIHVYMEFNTKVYNLSK